MTFGQGIEPKRRPGGTFLFVVGGDDVDRPGLPQRPRPTARTNKAGQHEPCLDRDASDPDLGFLVGLEGRGPWNSAMTVQPETYSDPTQEAAGMTLRVCPLDGAS